MHMPPEEWDSYLCPDDDEPNVGPPDDPDEWRDEADE